MYKHYSKNVNIIFTNEYMPVIFEDRRDLKTFSMVRMHECRWNSWKSNCSSWITSEDEPPYKAHSNHIHMVDWIFRQYIISFVLVETYEKDTAIVLLIYTAVRVNQSNSFRDYFLKEHSKIYGPSKFICSWCNDCGMIKKRIKQLDLLFQLVSLLLDGETQQWNCSNSSN